MMIDWNNFTPISALIGGGLIGIAIAMFLMINGRIAGISGIVGGLLRPKPGDTFWRIAFVLGVIAAPVLYGVFAILPESRVDAEWPMLVVAGLLVGLGTRYGSGCTSGHGVCGMSRLSPRSILATATFMSFGFVTVYVVRHLIGY